MSEAGVVHFGKITLILTGGLLWVLSNVPTYGVGMELGGGGGSTDGETICIPDDPLVIIPGPLGSPVRIVAFDHQTYLVADYSRKSLSWFDQSGALTLFVETQGKPLSIAVNAYIKKNGKLKEAYYFIGNDDARTIDVYYEKKNTFLLLGQYPVGENGVQALDMVFDKGQNQLFIVDGLAAEIKVVQPDGQLVRSFGAGVLSDPKGIAVDASNGEIFVSDYGDPFSFTAKASIEVFDMLGSHVRTISGTNLFSRPQGLALLDSKIYLTDNILSQILELDRVTGAKTSSFGCKGSSEEHLLLPMDVVLGDAGQSLYVADNRNMRVTVLPLSQP